MPPRKPRIRSSKLKVLLKSKTEADTLKEIPLSETIDLPKYKRFIDIQSSDHKYPTRVFFEAPLVDELPDKTYKLIGVPTVQSLTPPFVTYISEFCGEILATDLARLCQKYLTSKTFSNARVAGSLLDLKRICEYAKTLPQTEIPKSLQELNALFFSNLIVFQPEHRRANLKYSLNPIFKCSRHYDSCGLKKIRTKLTSPNTTVQEINIDELEKAFGENEYSDSVLTQLLAYSFFIIEDAMKRWDSLEKVSIESLGDDYISIDEISVYNPKLMKMLKNKNGGHEKIKRNLCLLIKNNIPQLQKSCHNKDIVAPSLFMKKIHDIYTSKEGIEILENQPFSNLTNWMFASYYPTRVKANRKHGDHKLSKSLWNFLMFNTRQVELPILIYTMITTGLNKEVITSWKCSYNGIPWYQNWNIELGLNENTSIRDQEVVLTGIKRKVGTRPPKQIGCPIKVNSPLFKYLKFLDTFSDPNRKYIFSSVWDAKYKSSFLKKFQVQDDDGNQLTSLDSLKFRKVYAGHKLMSLLEDVKSAGELVAKLKATLGHNKFDTTFFSYLMKSGNANLVLNAAIVALTSELLEKSVEFQGQINNNSNERVKERERYLCDCTDPEKPTHNLPIAKKCTRYDMCLGCKRSEVFSEHIPNILYRILQLEEYKFMKKGPSNDLIDDRLWIAKDTIRKFRNYHPRGEGIIEAGFHTANIAMRKGEILLPPILQF